MGVYHVSAQFAKKGSFFLKRATVTVDQTRIFRAPVDVENEVRCELMQDYPPEEGWVEIYVHVFEIAIEDLQTMAQFARPKAEIEEEQVDQMGS